MIKSINDMVEDLNYKLPEKLTHDHGVYFAFCSNGFGSCVKVLDVIIWDSENGYDDHIKTTILRDMNIGFSDAEAEKIFPYDVNETVLLLMGQHLAKRTWKLFKTVDLNKL